MIGIVYLHCTCVFGWLVGSNSIIPTEFMASITLCMDEERERGREGERERKGRRKKALYP